MDEKSDWNRDGVIDSRDKFTYYEAIEFAEELEFAGYDDWRLPTIKELYSLILFSGIDPSGYTGSNFSQLVPFIDKNYFEFGYGDIKLEKE